MFYKSRQYHKGFTLIEVLVVVAIIALLMAVMLPSLSAAREQTRSVICGHHLRQLGLAGAAYSDMNHGWLVGSPNTSGNGARPGFAAGEYTDTYNHDNYPALHVFDWANPLLHLVGAKPPVEFKQRYAAAVGDVFSCPSNHRKTGRVTPLNNLIPADAFAPSYAVSRHFMLVGESAKTGEVCGTLWWSDDCVPADYVPKFERIQRPYHKAFLADAHVVSKTKGEISNANWGFASQGAWRKLRDDDDGPVNYRGSFLRDQIWRHRGTINILAFDGHVERQSEGDSMARNGFGEKARRASWWFPSRTNTEKLPEGHSSEPELIVP